MSKVWGILIVALFLFSFVAAGNTKVTTVFSIGGCQVGDYNFAYDTCLEEGEYAGLYFCPEFDNDPLITTEDEEACTCGISGSAYTSSGSTCCPNGMTCKVPEDGSYSYRVCVQNDFDCSTLSDEGECEDHGSSGTDDDGCFWINESVNSDLTDDERCVDGDDLDNEGCEFYTAETACNVDYFDLIENSEGSTSIGEEFVCGGYTYVYTDDSSGCMWDGDSCISDVGAQQIGSESGQILSCEQEYTVGECGAVEEGYQSVSWTAVVEGLLTLVSSDGDLLTAAEQAECQESMGCESGAEDRFCGEASIKLPGFSLFSLILSVAIIGLFYFKRRN